MEIFFWLKFVCFDSPVGVASSAAPEEKSSTTNDNFFFKNWIWFYIFQQNLSKKLSRQMLFRIEKGRTFVTNIFTWIFMWAIILPIVQRICVNNWEKQQYAAMWVKNEINYSWCILCICLSNFSVDVEQRTPFQCILQVTLLYLVKIDRCNSVHIIYKLYKVTKVIGSNTF